VRHWRQQAREGGEEARSGEPCPESIDTLRDDVLNSYGLLPKSWSSCYESPLAPFGKEDFP